VAQSWLDRAFVRVMRRKPFFSDGWGDLADLASVTSIPDETAGVHPIAPVWGAWEQDGRLEVRAGRFESPEAAVLPLPPESREAIVRQVRPLGAERGPTCVHLAATGEFGFSRRMRMARSLAAAGIGSILLENPYYGLRAPPEQNGPSVRTVADLLIMGRACVQEARSLLGWLHDQGHAQLGVSGFSMGGQTAAMTAGSVPFPVAGVPLAGSHSATAVFLEGVLRYVVDWDALAPDGDHAAARKRLVSLLDSLSVQSLPAPALPAACIVVAGTRDAFVQPPSSQALHAHWEGSELRWLPTGHVGGYLWNQGVYKSAIIDAFRRLEGLLAAQPVSEHVDPASPGV
jgi:dienelactone hydrolase